MTTPCSCSGPCPGSCPHCCAYTWPLPLPLPLHLPHACPFLACPTSASCLICFQRHPSSLVDCRSVIDEIGDGAEEVDLGGRSIAMRAYASWFNFKGADQQKSVGVLSGGERNRLQLAKVCIELSSQRGQSRAQCIQHTCSKHLRPSQVLVKHDVLTQQYDAAPCSLFCHPMLCYTMFAITQFGVH